MLSAKICHASDEVRFSDVQSELEIDCCGFEVAYRRAVRQL